MTKSKSTSCAPIDTTDRLAKLRALFKEEKYNLAAYVIPSEDAHQSEYTASRDARRAFISGFTGSAGLAVVTTDSAAMFTDGRYFLQAGQQMDSNWTLMKQGLPDVPTWQEYLTQNIPKGSRIGIDPQLISTSDAKSLNESLGRIGSKMAYIDDNLVDLVWGDDRPPFPKDPVTVLPLKYADVLYNPIFFAYSLVTKNDIILYIEDYKLTQEVKEELSKSDIKFKPYNAIFEGLKSLQVNLKNDNQENVEEARSPVTDAKAIKNEVELEGMRKCHLRDAAALINYFAWLEEQLNAGAVLNEVDGADRLEKFRAEQEDFVGLSFDTISSSGPNGAIIHYKPEPETCAIIDPKLLYLCDSGGQYKNGTTDVTRTIHFGKPTEQEKRAFTRVLQGHIAIDQAVFPKGTTGYLLDVLARTSLWKDGLDYRHGTGHGVGCYLNVHEGPHGIGTRIAFNDAPLQVGMTVTDEPGYYEDGKFGIRIENVLLVRQAETPNNFGDRGYFGFEHITLVPIQTKLIDTTLLSPSEHKWINDYHNDCLEKVKPFLEPGSLGLKWLERECAAI
nr:7571_t:CDS:10 [Entrophospora candida]